MENEVSSISKLGIVLIALAVLIGLAFGIFQISKGTANTGVNNVQEQLDSVSASTYTTYDQTTITGTMVRSAISDFEGKNTAILVATQAWINVLADDNANKKLTETASSSGKYNATKVKYYATSDYYYTSADDANKGTKTEIKKTDGSTSDTAAVAPSGSAISDAYSPTKNELPVVLAFDSDKYTTPYIMNASNGIKSTAATGSEGASKKDSAFYASFINYNALLGSTTSGVAGADSVQTCYTSGAYVYMADVYFDSNCFRCVTGFATTSAGQVIFNNVTKNIQKTGATEFIPTGAKFSSFLVKDASGTTMGIAVIQSSSN
jgi:hypothetical protein